MTVQSLGKVIVMLAVLSDEVSNYRLTATSSVTDAGLKYILLNGSLPGLKLSLDGEINGRLDGEKVTFLTQETLHWMEDLQQ